MIIYNALFIIIIYHNALLLAAEDVAHVVLRDHGALVLGQVVAVRHHGVVEVALAGDVLGEVVHGDLDRGRVVGHGI